VSGSSDPQPTWSLLLKIKMGDEILKIFISETTGPIPPFLFLVTATMLAGGRNCRTQFWKVITNRPFHQSLVLSGQVVAQENIPFKFLSGNPDIQPTWPLLLKTEKVDNFFPLKLLSQLDSSFAKIILW
jgi:hypothetical protein